MFCGLRKGPELPSLCACCSLPELLLYPSRRFEEYIHLLYALRLHTPAEHIDRGNLTIAIDQMKNYKGYIDQVGCWEESVSFKNVMMLLWYSDSKILKSLSLLGFSSDFFILLMLNHCIQWYWALRAFILNQIMFSDISLSTLIQIKKKEQTSLFLKVLLNVLINFPA